MDWTTFLDLFWSPLWFFWDLCGTVAIIFLIRKWIRGSVTDTKDQVIAEITNSEVSKRLKTAMDIPDRADVIKVADQVKALDVAFQTALDARLKGVVDDIKAEIPKVPEGITVRQIEDIITSAIARSPAIDPEHIGKLVAASVSGSLGTATKADKKAQEEFVRQYEESAGAAVDSQIAYKLLTSMGMAPNLAQMAAVGGPPAIRWAVDYAFGAKEAMKLAAGWDKGRATIYPMLVK